MASESTTSIALNENSGSSDWSSSEEKNKTTDKVIQLKLSKEKKLENPTKSKFVKKRRRIVSVCLTHCRYEVIRRVAQKFAYKEVNEGENWNMYWTDLSITVDRCKEMKRFQKINHFPGKDYINFSYSLKVNVRYTWCTSCSIFRIILWYIRNNFAPTKVILVGFIMR